MEKWLNKKCKHFDFGETFRMYWKCGGFHTLSLRSWIRCKLLWRVGSAAFDDAEFDELSASSWPGSFFIRIASICFPDIVSHLINAIYRRTPYSDLLSPFCPQNISMKMQFFLVPQSHFNRLHLLRSTLALEKRTIFIFVWIIKYFFLFRLCWHFYIY